jgi:hypothetical protein
LNNNNYTNKVKSENLTDLPNKYNFILTRIFEDPAKIKVAKINAKQEEEATGKYSTTITTNDVF